MTVQSYMVYLHLLFYQSKVRKSPIKPLIMPWDLVRTNTWMKHLRSPQWAKLKALCFWLVDCLTTKTGNQFLSLDHVGRESSTVLLWCYTWICIAKPLSLSASACYNGCKYGERGCPHCVTVLKCARQQQDQFWVRDRPWIRSLPFPYSGKRIKIRLSCFKWSILVKCLSNK